MTRRKSREQKPLVITPQMRIEHLDSSRKFLREINFGYARRFPWSYFKKVLSACGLPLEATRWINQNEHKPAARVKEIRSAISERWDALKVSLYRVPKRAYELGTEDEFRDFVASMREKKNKVGSTFRRGPFFFTEPGDLIINREIVEPGTNGSFLNGATGFRFDEDFFTFAIFPYRFRRVPVETVMAVLFPHRPLSEYDFLPDHGSKEMEDYISNRWQSEIAIELAAKGRAKNSYDDTKVTVTDDVFTVQLLIDCAVAATMTFTREQVVAYYEKKYECHNPG